MISDDFFWSERTPFSLGRLSTFIHWPFVENEQKTNLLFFFNKFKVYLWSGSIVQLHKQTYETYLIPVTWYCPSHKTPSSTELLFQFCPSVCLDLFWTCYKLQGDRVSPPLPAWTDYPWSEDDPAKVNVWGFYVCAREENKIQLWYVLPKYLFIYIISNNCRM